MWQRARETGRFLAVKSEDLRLADTIRARFVRLLLNFAILTTMLSSSYDILEGRRDLILLDVVLLLTLLVMRLLVWRGYVALVAHTVVWIALAMVIVSDAVVFSGLSYIWYGLIVVIAGVLTNARVTVAVGVIGLMLFIGEGMAREGVLSADVADNVIYLATITAVMVLVRGGLGEAFASAARHADDLRESERRYRGLLEGSPAAIAVIDVATNRFAYVNPAGLAMLGATEAAQLIGRDVGDLVFETFKPHGPDDPTSLVRCRRLDGVVVTLEVNGLRIDYNGKPSNLVVGQDVTQRQAHLEALREREETYRSLMEDSPVAKLIIDVQTLKVLAINQATVRLFGAESKQHVFDHYPSAREMVTGEHLGQLYGRFENYRRQAEQPLAEYKLVRVDGSVVLAEAISTMMVYQGTPAIITVLMDITERRKTEQALRESEERYRVLMEASPVAKLMIDLETMDIMDANAAALVLFGVTELAELHQHFSDALALVAPEERPQVNARMKAFRAGQMLPEVELTMRVADGSTFQAEVISMPAHYATHPILITVITDVTERREMARRLAESETRYRAIVETQVEMLCRYRVEDLALTFVNDAFAAAFGMTTEALIGQPFTILVPDERHGQVRQHVDDIVHTGQATRHEQRTQLADGIPRWHQWTNTPIIGPDGSVQEIQATGLDITERKAMEQALRESETRYRTIVENQQEMVCRYTPQDLRLTFVNTAYADYFGKSAEALIGTSVLEQVIPEERDIMREMVEAQMRHKLVRYAERRSFDRRREQRWHHWTDVPILDEAGDILEIQATGRDITERKQVEQALRESEERYRLILETAPMAVALSLVSDRRIYYCNQSFVQMMGGTSSGDFIGKPMQDLIPAEDHARYDAMREAFLEAGYAEGDSLRLIRLDGAVIDVEVGAVRLHLLGQLATLSVIYDVTERRRAERERNQAEQLRLALEAERQMVAMRESFIAMMSHEFRTPLTVIRSSTALISQYLDRLTPERRTYHLNKIDLQVDHMVGMLDDILMLSKASAGMLEFDPRLADLPDACREIVNDFRFGDSKDHAIHFEVRGEWQPMALDIKLLRHILDNLLSNASKYSEPGTSIEVVVSPADGANASITVTDHGQGIPLELQPRLFEPFTRADAVKTIQGTGLGLAIVQTSVQLHGGMVMFKSEPGSGTTFSVLLPMRQNLAPTRITSEIPQINRNHHD